MAAENVRHPDTEKTEEHQSEATRCKKKKLKFMKFSLSMEDTEMDPNSQPEGEEKDIEDDCLFDDDLFHSLPNISLNLCVDQDSDDDNPLSNSDLQSNESVVTPENDEITYISAQILEAIREQKNWFLKAFEERKYVAPKQNALCLEDTKSAKITISYVMFNGKVTKDNTSGTPVVLNFTGTDNFLACDMVDNKKILTVKMYDKNKIDMSEGDTEKASPIFYMSQKYDGLRYFESVRYRGWYIHTIDHNIVKMERGNASSNSCFVLE